MMRVRSFAVGLASLGLVVSLSACSPDTAESNTAYCTGSAAVQSEVAKLKSMVTDGSFTLDEISAQRDAVASAVAAAADDAEKLADDVKKEIEAADGDFDEAIKAIPADATLMEAATAYKAAIAAWEEDLKSIKGTLGCE